MRIRKRAATSSSYLTSPTPPPLPLVPDPALQAPQGGGVDGATNGGGKAPEELHQVGDLKINPHLARAGQVQQEMEEGMVKREGEEEHWSKRWNPQINSNKSDSTPSALLVKASCDSNGDKVNHDAGWSKKAKDKEKKIKTKAAASGDNYTRAGVNDSDDEGCNIKGGTAGKNGSAGGKRRRSPAVLMEGSRCSRVNGRGWRCCQQTLVGYSLCEHHLGKGRLRSMSSVRGQIGATTRPKKNADAMAAVPSPAPQAHDEKDEDEARTRKKKKIGMVKARSISSLLDAVDHVTSSAATMAPPLELAPTSRFTAAGAGAALAAP